MRCVVVQPPLDSTVRDPSPPNPIRLRNVARHSAVDGVRWLFPCHDGAVDETALRALIEQVRSGEASPDDAVAILRRLPFADLDDAKVDHHRALRQGLPEAVYGPGKTQLTTRVGIDTFGFFLHLGGSNRIPLTYVDNCAEAIVLASITKGVDGEVFNIVDDNLPTSRAFLRMYKKNAKRFGHVYLPYPLFYIFCFFWEKYSQWSEGQLPAVFNPRRCSAYWKKHRYSNKKLKDMLGWKPIVTFEEGAKRFFEYVRQTEVQK